MATTKLYTIADIRDMDDAAHYDLIEGELFRMPPAREGHGLRVGRLFGWLSAYVLPNRLGEMLGAETGYILARDPDTLLSPDGAFIRADRVPDDYGRTGFSDIVPDLVIEVLSPSERGPAIRRKTDAYLEAGVIVVWVVDPAQRTVTVWQAEQDPVIVPQTGELDGGEVVPGFRLKLTDVFG